MLGKTLRARPASAICLSLIAGQTTPRAASSALADSSQWWCTTSAGVPSGNASTSRRAALTRVWVVLAPIVSMNSSCIWAIESRASAPLAARCTVVSAADPALGVLVS